MHTAPSWSFGPFEFNARTFRLKRGTETVPLEPKAMDVLRVLLERAPDVVEKSELFETVWRDVAVTDNALTRVVTQLRRALDDDAKRPRYIETVATRGYRMLVDVRLAPAGTTDSAAPSAKPVPQPVSVAASEPAGGDGELPGDRFQPKTQPAADEQIAGESPSARRRVWWRSRPGTVLLSGFVLLGATGFLLRPFASKSVDAGRQPARPLSGEPAIERIARLVPAQVTTGSGLDAQPAFSRDGSTLAFSSDRSGAFEIYVQSLAAGAVPTALTSNGRLNIQPTWSPDGRFIAYHEAYEGGIWIVPSRGGASRRLVDMGSYPAWSPDGRSIAYQTFVSSLVPTVKNPTGPSSVRVADAATGAWRDITTGRADQGPLVAPRWSHDGRRLYFMETPPPFTDGEEDVTTLWSADVASGAARIEAQSVLIVPDYALAADESGAWLTAPTGTVWWMPLLGDLSDRKPQPTGLPSAAVPGELVTSPDGNLLSWSARQSATQLWSVDVPSSGSGTGSPRPLPLGTGVRVTGAVAAPDGRLAYAGTLRGSRPQIWLRGTDGNIRQITLDDGVHTSPVWMSGASEVAHFSEHGDVQSINATNVDTLAERVLFRMSDIPIPAGARLHRMPGLNVSIDPTATLVVMALETKGIVNLWVSRRSPAGLLSPPRQLTHESQGGSFPHWSADSRWVSYQCDDGADTHVCVVGADGTGQQRLTRERGQSFIGGWKGADEILVAAQRGAVWNVVGVNRMSGRETRYTNFDDARSYVRYPQWEPTGEHVTFERAEVTGNIWLTRLQ